jgi:2,4-dienoyl-CoA reductase (NADPH2)
LFLPSLADTGIGWHEARIPTIATVVPRAAFAWVTGKLKGSVTIPLVATNRINTPEVAEKILAEGQADLISMARPFLADAYFVQKAAEGRSDEINTCIACNQACLDHTFKVSKPRPSFRHHFFFFFFFGGLPNSRKRSACLFVVAFAWV